VQSLDDAGHILNDLGLIATECAPNGGSGVASTAASDNDTCVGFESDVSSDLDNHSAELVPADYLAPPTIPQWRVAPLEHDGNAYPTMWACDIGLEVITAACAAAGTPICLFRCVAENRPFLGSGAC